jgi:hypothetical protein
MIRQAGEHVSKPRLRVGTVKFGGDNQGIDSSRAAIAFVEPAPGMFSTMKFGFPAYWRMWR